MSSSGQPTKQGPVVLLSEQGGTSLREALARAGLLERDDLHLALYRDIAALVLARVVADAFAFATRGRRRAAGRRYPARHALACAATTRTRPAAPWKPWTRSKSAPIRTASAW